MASESGHDIHQDQPELVIEAIRQVFAGVRNPDTWYDLAVLLRGPDRPLLLRGLTEPPWLMRYAFSSQE